MSRDSDLNWIWPGSRSAIQRLFSLIQVDHPSISVTSLFAAFNKYWDGQEFFLDRHRNSFEVIANWLSIGGELVCPDTIPIDVFLYEISFYQLPVPAIEDFLRNEGLLMEKEEEVKNLVRRTGIQVVDRSFFRQQE